MKNQSPESRATSDQDKDRDKAQPTSTTGLAANDVAEFLAAHPDFFADQDDLLFKLNIPHSRGSTVSLVERQVGLLRERNRALQHELDGLLSTARENDKTFAKCRKLLVLLLEAESTDEFLDGLEKSLKRDFACKTCRLIIYGSKARQINSWTSMLSNDEAKAHLGGLATSRRPVLGVLRDSEKEYLFGADAKRIKSTALFPIRKRKEIALLALGSSKETQFQSGMGTMFTDFLTDSLARMIPRFKFH
jgi:uncharacterized protein YigA (DUF484 family)